VFERRPGKCADLWIASKNLTIGRLTLLRAEALGNAARESDCVGCGMRIIGHRPDRDDDAPEIMKLWTPITKEIAGNYIQIAAVLHTA
jgi:hypothetical protein